MNDLPLDLLPPNIAHLQRVQRGENIPPDATEITLPELDFQNSPFLHEIDKSLTISCQDPTFGIELGTCAITNRTFISGLRPPLYQCRPPLQFPWCYPPQIPWCLYHLH
jgi:hypothetical protein